MKNIKLDLSNIRSTRKANGYSQKRLAEATCINEKRLIKAEKENKIQLEDLLKLATFFDVDEKELYRYSVLE